MRNPLSDKIVKIPPSGIRKFFDIVSEMKDAISLGVGEPDFETPWHIREEGIYSLEKGRTFYTSNAGLKPLKVEICEYLKRRCGVTYDPDQEILVTVGGSEAIDIALRAMLNEGDEVLIPQPSYVSYMPCVTLADGVPVTIELEEKDQYAFFMGGNQSLAVVRTEHTDAPKLLIVRDSYTDSLVPFLTAHFSEIHLVDPRYNKTPLSGYLAENEIDQVLVLYSAANFVSDTNLFVLSK